VASKTPLTPKSVQPTKIDTPSARVWEKAFIAELRATGIVSSACTAAHINRTTAYDRRKANKEFARAWRVALTDAADDLEKEARRRAIEGIDVPIYSQGKFVDTHKQYSDGLLTLLLKAHKPKKFRDRLEVTDGNLTKLMAELKRRGIKASDVFQAMLDELAASDAANAINGQ
jgi:hypothetical protein